MALLQSHKLSARGQALASYPFFIHTVQAPKFCLRSATQHQAQATAVAAPTTRRQLLAASVLAPVAASRRQTVAMASAVGGHDLLIVGPGVLGSFLGTLWKQEYPDSTVTAQTNSESSHDR